MSWSAGILEAWIRLLDVHFTKIMVTRLVDSPSAVTHRRVYVDSSVRTFSGPIMFLRLEVRPPGALVCFDIKSELGFGGGSNVVGSMVVV
jgi:hypothetical protein